MSGERIFGVNQRGDLRFLAWTCFAAESGRIVPGSFKEISHHATEDEAHEAANAARARHLPSPPSP